jgi:hypothetical protein
LLISKVKQYLTSVGEPAGPTQRIAMPEADSAINLFDTEAPVTPPDDNEKTMMLPGGPFGDSLFAENPPAEQASPPELPKSSLDIDSVKPVGEVVFGEEAFPEVELGAQEEEKEEENLFVTQKAESSKEDEKFVGREEREFEYSSGPVVEAPFGEKPGVSESVPLILPTADEPFGDVFK